MIKEANQHFFWQWSTTYRSYVQLLIICTTSIWIKWSQLSPIMQHGLISSMTRVKMRRILVQLTLSSRAHLETKILLRLVLPSYHLASYFKNRPMNTTHHICLRPTWMNTTHHICLLWNKIPYLCTHGLMHLLACEDHTPHPGLEE